MGDGDAEREGRRPDARFTMANERTFLAWNRTSLALIGGGLAAGQLLDFRSDAARLAVALPPILLGAVVAVSSHRRWQCTEEALRHDAPIPEGGLQLLLSVGIVLIALIVAVALVLDAA